MSNEIAYLPYMFLNDSFFEFDGDILWNLSDYSQAQKYISDKSTRNYINKLLESNRFHGEPIKNIFIFHMKNKNNFSPFSDAEKQRMRDFCKVLFLCSASESNTRNSYHSFVTSENFISSIQRFKNINDKYTGYSTGRIITKNDFGYKIGEINYDAPLYINNNGFSFDPDLLSALEELKRKNTNLFSRILKATDAMMSGYCNADHVSYETRILMQSRCFEILFDFKGRQKRDGFRTKIQSYCQKENEDNRTQIETYKKDKLISIDVTMQMAWAEKFYLLRNKITHGDDIISIDFNFLSERHWELGLLFYIVAVKNLINEALDKKIFKHVISYDAERNKLFYDRQLRLHYNLPTNPNV